MADPFDTPLPPDADEALWVELLSGDRSTEDPQVRARAAEDPKFAQRLATLRALGASFERVARDEAKILPESERLPNAPVESPEPPRPTPVAAPRTGPRLLAWSGWAAAAALLVWTRPWSASSPTPTTTDSIDSAIAAFEGTLLAASQFPIEFKADETGGGSVEWDLGEELDMLSSYLLRVSATDPSGTEQLLLEEELFESRREWETLPWPTDSTRVEIQVELQQEGTLGAIKRAELELSPSS